MTIIFLALFHSQFFSAVSHFFLLLSNVHHIRILLSLGPFVHRQSINQFHQCTICLFLHVAMLQQCDMGIQVYHRHHLVSTYSALSHLPLAHLCIALFNLLIVTCRFCIHPPKCRLTSCSNLSCVCNLTNCYQLNSLGVKLNWQFDFFWTVWRCSACRSKRQTIGGATTSRQL